MAAITIRVADIKGISCVEPYPFIAPSDAISTNGQLNVRSGHAKFFIL